MAKLSKEQFWRCASRNTREEDQHQKVSVSTPASRATYSAQYSITMSKDSNNNLMKTIFNPINLIREITIHQKQSSKVNSQLPWPHGPLFFSGVVTD
ncbi:SAGA complex subunit spt3 [Fusarium oxysporum f. sp. albedinis]|nr:SAGA complex subunit spt3 [Fusarium oxysporum f. sp. albedinis]